MDVLTSAKSTYLLEAGLEVLHEQSNEWLNEIAFWRDEAAFLYSLILTKTFRSVPVNAKDKLEKIETELISITGGELDNLQASVDEHERFLHYLLQCDENDQESYRQKHRELGFIFNQFEKRFKTLKMDVFALAESVNL